MKIEWKAARSQPIKGVRIETYKIGGSLYARLIHIQSSKSIREFTKTVIVGGIGKFTERCVDALSPFNFDVPADVLIANEKVIYSAVSSISYEA